MHDDDFRELMQQLRLGTWPERKRSALLIAQSDHRSAARFLATRFNYESTRTVRSIISKALLEMGLTGVEAIIYAFDDNYVWDEPEVRDRLKDLLLAFGVITFEPVLAMLQHTDWRMRNTAAELLGGLGDERAIAPLLNVLNNPESMGHIGAAQGLAQLKAKQAIEPLKAWLTHENSYLQQTVKEALAQLED